MEYCATKYLIARGISTNAIPRYKNTQQTPGFKRAAFSQAASTGTCSPSFIASMTTCVLMRRIIGISAISRAHSAS